MNKLLLVVLLFAVLQATNCSPAKRDWVKEIEETTTESTESYKATEEDKDKDDTKAKDDKEEQQDDKSLNKEKDDKNEDSDKDEDKDDEDKNGNDLDQKTDEIKKEELKIDDDKKEEIDDLASEVNKEIKEESPEYGSGEDIAEGDIKMTPEQAAIFKSDGWDGLVKSEAWMRNHGVWQRYIPYTISSDIGSAERSALMSSIDMLQQFTCLHFIPRTNQQDYIQFVNRGGCWSYLGRQGGTQQISLGTGCRDAVGAHEIMHALGRHHEQSRADRDSYVRILTQNIIPRFRSNFDRETTSDSQGIPYDYLSLMHYGRTAFASSRGLTTIEPIQTNAMIGQRERLTMYDVLQINIRYCPERAVRLVGGNLHKGRVEVFWNEQWGTVCDDYFDQRDGNVICEYLGFPGASCVYRRARFGQGSGPIWFDNMRCSGNERSPFHCTKNQIGQHNCRHYEDASVNCNKNIRLAGGPSRRVGRVEVYANKQWGTVCDDGFGIEEANVICRQLGFRRATRFYGSARYGQGTGEILLDDLVCNGDEQQITHCRGNPIGQHDCSHSEDASVECV